VSWRRALAVAELGIGQPRVVALDGTRLLLCKLAEGEVYAVEDRCTHDDGPLGEGDLDGCAIECPRHGARFDVRTGEVLRMPAAAPLPVFPVKVTNGEVWIEVEKE
jgi:3-phenylpropionate/trans-cinnamate dioxygenase ferredoxin subunit